MAKDGNDTGSPPTDDKGKGKGKGHLRVVPFKRRDPDDGWTEAEQAMIDEWLADGMPRDAALRKAAVHRQNEPARIAAIRRQADRERARGSGSGTGQSPSAIVPIANGQFTDPPKPSDSAAHGQDDEVGGRSDIDDMLDRPKPLTLPRRYPSEYQSWRSMKSRRGDCSVDPVWLGKGGFEQFISDMHFKPTPSHTLDRIDHADLRYGPGLCRWASKKEQTRNRRNTIFLTDNTGVSRTLNEWAEATGVKPDAFRKRYQRRRATWSQHEIIYGKDKDAPPSAEKFSWPGNEAAQAKWSELYRCFAKDYPRPETQARFVVRHCHEQMYKLTGDLPPAQNSEGEEPHVWTADELERIEEAKRWYATAEKYDRLADPKTAPPDKPDAEAEADVESEFGYYGRGYEYD